MGDIEAMRSRMLDAIANGEWFEIVYHGGSRPGARRRIAPIAVTGEQVRARCYTSDSVKPFRLDRIEIVDPESASGATWTPGGVKGRPDGMLLCSDVELVHAACRDALIAAGWAVGIDDDGDIRTICARGWFKNGKMKRAPSHALRYTPTVFDMIANPDGSTTLANHRPNPKPWTAAGIGYRDLRKPLTTFLLAAGVGAEGIATAIATIERGRPTADRRA